MSQKHLRIIICGSGSWLPTLPASLSLTNSIPISVWYILIKDISQQSLQIALVMWLWFDTRDINCTFWILYRWLYNRGRGWGCPDSRDDYPMPGILIFSLILVPRIEIWYIELQQLILGHEDIAIRLKEKDSLVLDETS